MVVRRTIKYKAHSCVHRQNAGKERTTISRKESTAEQGTAMRYDINLSLSSGWLKRMARPSELSDTNQSCSKSKLYPG